ncbi:MAG: NifB/NifX family molybdenum-iron cluster-binding protein [Bacteroidales bacterium]|nr:NifB/NifX family molybdenum-iron cluster-binding protein [Bacteroidales bacterium]
MKKIAIPLTSDNRVDDHFGHCEFYGVYTIADNKEITDFQTIKSQQGCGCKSNIAAVLSNQGVTIMLAGGIGAGAINVLNHWGINVVRGCSGLAQDVIAAYLKGEIIDNGESCQHHEHHHQNGQQCNN